MRTSVRRNGKLRHRLKTGSKIFTNFKIKVEETKHPCLTTVRPVTRPGFVQDKQNQNLRYYHYTIGQFTVATPQGLEPWTYSIKSQ